MSEVDKLFKKRMENCKRHEACYTSDEMKDAVLDHRLYMIQELYRALKEYNPELAKEIIQNHKEAYDETMRRLEEKYGVVY